MLSPLQLVRGTVDATLARLIATGGPFDPAALFAGAAASIAGDGVNTVIGDVTAPTGDAGDRLAVVWGSPYVLNSGAAVVDSEPLVFRPGAGESVVITGAYMASALAAGSLKGFWQLSEPIGLTEALAWTLVVRLTVSPSGLWDVSLSWNG